VRLGLYADLEYRREGEALFADRAFIRFVTALPPRVRELVVFGRLEPGNGRHPYELPTESVRFVPLPFYAGLRSPAALARAVPGSLSSFSKELANLDAVWLFGPHPLALAFAAAARARGTPIFLGVRQDLPAYVSGQLPHRGWAWAIPTAWALDRAFRILGRRAPTVVAGEDLARRYRGGSAPVHVATFSLVVADDFVTTSEACARSWDGDVHVLTVGRLDREKNPLLLPEVLAALRGESNRWRLTVVGDGELGPAVRRRASELGLGTALELSGYIPNGPALRRLYRQSHAFLHVSLTEGLPQVLLEAQAAGLPVVATEVGGVAEALGHGRSGLLVPPGDAAACAAALRRLAADEGLRRELVAAGLAHAAAHTMEAELDRLGRFLHAHTEETQG
jgi:glycosyltransferase involved in cell wall biosynthesis